MYKCFFSGCIAATIVVEILFAAKQAKRLERKACAPPSLILKISLPLRVQKKSQAQITQGKQAAIHHIKIYIHCNAIDMPLTIVLPHQPISLYTWLRHLLVMRCPKWIVIKLGS